MKWNESEASIGRVLAIEVRTFTILILYEFLLGFVDAIL